MWHIPRTRDGEEHALTKSSKPTIARVVEVTDWEQVATLIAYFSYNNGIPWLFRGATKLSYTLVPSVGRDERKPKPLAGLPDRRVPYSARDEKAVFSMFVQGARARTCPRATRRWNG